MKGERKVRMGPELLQVERKEKETRTFIQGPYRTKAVAEAVPKLDLG